MSEANQKLKSWRLVELSVEALQEELAGWLMIQLGANGCQIYPAEDGRVLLQATFEWDVLPESKEAALTAALDEYGLNQSIASLRFSQLVEEDWLTKWKEGFDPFPVGARLLICPPWHRDSLKAEQLAGRCVVLIEPGLAFGTGFHETTRFCLLALQDYVVEAQNILDIGTGSGILSIAAAHLNATAVIVAAETDPVACKNAGENLQLNNVSLRIQLVEASTDVLLDTMPQRFDLIFANLTYEDHVALMADYVRLAEKGAHLLFAGILKEKEQLMSDLIARHGLAVVRKDVGQAWAGFVARKS